jgi:thiol-disulfide isomerase/thioredoxin
MQRKLLIVACLMSTALIAFGQKKKKDKATEQSAVETTADTAKINYKEIGAPMPPLKVQVVKGKTVTKQIITAKDLSNKSNLFVLMFNPTCEHCQDATRMLEQNLFLFKKSQLLLMAVSTMEAYMEFFDSVTKVSQYPSIKVGLDQSQFIDKTFTYQMLPQINIYDKDRKLIKIFTGDTPIDSLKPYIE